LHISTGQWLLVFGIYGLAAHGLRGRLGEEEGKADTAEQKEQWVLHGRWIGMV